MFRSKTIYQNLGPIDYGLKPFHKQEIRRFQTVSYPPPPPPRHNVSLILNSAVISSSYTVGPVCALGIKWGAWGFSHPCILITWILGGRIIPSSLTTHPPTTHPRPSWEIQTVRTVRVQREGNKDPFHCITTHSFYFFSNSSTNFEEAA
jgi:hypothetical protein